mmetsp:Transcript_132793/g.314727  ORF Transcript_132793/g.314727 Transcript_132793/m.314727 type:complete len:264 (+) Transcript_132793:1506-2297(+)
MNGSGPIPGILSHPPAIILPPVIAPNLQADDLPSLAGPHPAHGHEGFGRVQGLVLMSQILVQALRAEVQVFADPDHGMDGPVLDVQGKLERHVLKPPGRISHPVEGELGALLREPFVQTVLEGVGHRWAERHDLPLAAPLLCGTDLPTVGVEANDEDRLQVAAAHLSQIPFLIPLELHSTHRSGSGVANMRIVRPNDNLQVLPVDAEELSGLRTQSQDSCHHVLIPRIPTCPRPWWLQPLLGVVLIGGNHALQVLLHVELVEL